MKITKEMRTSNEELEKLGLPPHSYKYKFHELDLWTQIAIHRQIVKQKYNISYLIEADYIKKENDCTYTVCTSEKNCTAIYVNFSKKHKDWAIEQAKLWRNKDVCLI